MTVLTGKGGKVTYDSNFVAEVSEWSIDLGADTIDTTVFKTDNSTAWRTFLATLKSWSGSLTLKGADLTDTNGQKAMFDAVGSDPETCQFYLDSTHYLEGDIIMTGFPINAVVDGEVGGSVDFQGTDALTYN